MLRGQFGDSRGSLLVEFGLVMAVLAALSGAILSLPISLNTTMVMQMSAQAGARAGARHAPEAVLNIDEVLGCGVETAKSLLELNGFDANAFDVNARGSTLAPSGSVVVTVNIRPKNRLPIGAGFSFRPCRSATFALEGIDPAEPGMLGPDFSCQ